MNSKCALINFGLQCRQLRTEAGYTIGHQAEALGLRTSDVASIESGREAIPSGYIDAFAYWLKLTPKVVSMLKDFASRRRAATIFPGMDRNQTIAIMRSFKYLPKYEPALIRGLERHLKAVANDRLSGT